MMHYCASKVSFLENTIIELTYFDGRVVRYDMSMLFSKYPQLEELRKNPELFKRGHLDPGGYGVSWNDNLDVDATGIYFEGEFVRYDEVSVNNQIGFLLAKTRDDLHITQNELSKLSRINQGDISKIEKGIGNPTLSKIEKLFNALGKKISFKIS